MRARTTAVALLALLTWPAVAQSTENSPQFCSSHVIHDYLKPLGGLPTLHNPPRDPRLPFGPPSVQLLSGPQLRVGAGEIGFSLVYSRLPRPLNWLVTASLAKVGRNGDSHKQLKTKDIEVGRPSRGTFDDLYFPVPTTSALYRIDILFRNRSGKRLARYGRYFRVVPSRLDVRLGLSASSYRGEEIVYGRIENYGTLRVSYGAAYVIERYDGLGWSEAPESPRVFIRPLYSADLGMTGRCFDFKIPAEMPSGLYRMSKQVEGSSGPVALTAEFELLPPAP